MLNQNRKDQTNLNAGLVGCKIFRTMEPTSFNRICDNIDKYDKMLSHHFLFQSLPSIII